MEELALATVLDSGRLSRTDAPTAPAVDVKSAAMRYRETLLMALCLGHDAVGHELPHRANSVRVAGVSGNDNHSRPREDSSKGPWAAGIAVCGTSWYLIYAKSPTVSTEVLTQPTWESRLTRSVSASRSWLRRWETIGSVGQRHLPDSFTSAASGQQVVSANSMYCLVERRNTDTAGRVAWSLDS